MKKEQQAMPTYEAPKVEVVAVEIEKGFAVSTHIGVNGWGNGGNLGDYETE